MVGLVCKLCGSNVFVKEDDFFVCQHCGCKYTAEEAKHSIVDPLLDLTFSMIAKYINGIDEKGNKIGIRDPEYDEAQKYLGKVEAIDPGNWKLWFYKGIIEELNSPTLFRAEVISSFYYFENAMKFADEITITTRILPVIDRFKQQRIDRYISCEGEWWSMYEYYPVFLQEFMKFFMKYDIASSYAQKTSDEWDSLMPIAEKQQNKVKKENKQDKKQLLEKDVISMNRYKNRMIEAIAEIRLYPSREAKLKGLLNGCGFFEVDKKEDLERKIRELDKRKKDAEDTEDKIKTKAYLLMKNNVTSPPARDIWEETFVRVVSDYVEKCYIYKEKPDKEDKDELNAKLFPIGFGFEYYLSEMEQKN